MRYFVSAAALAALGGMASAGGVTVTYRDTLGIPFTAGSGNTNTNFAISRDSGSGVELGLKAKERFFGDGNVGGTGDLYIVQAGYSPVSGSDPTPDPSRAWWNFDFSIDLNQNTFNDTSLHMLITNNINSISIDLDISAVLQGGGLGGLSVYQNSYNMGFAFLGSLGFDANDVGTYSFELVAYGMADGTPNLGDVGMTVQVDGPTVPLPSGAGLGLAGLGLRIERARSSP
jgi:hypothetical protein